MTQRDQRLRALDAGSDEFVAKPFDLEELLIRVRSLLRTKRLTDHLVSDEAVLVALSRRSRPATTTPRSTSIGWPTDRSRSPAGWA